MSITAKYAEWAPGYTAVAAPPKSLQEKLGAHAILLGADTRFGQIMVRYFAQEGLEVILLDQGQSEIIKDIAVYLQERYHRVIRLCTLEEILHQPEKWLDNWSKGIVFQLKDDQKLPRSIFAQGTEPEDLYTDLLKVLCQSEIQFCSIFPQPKPEGQGNTVKQEIGRETPIILESTISVPLGYDVLIPAFYLQLAPVGFLQQACYKLLQKEMEQVLFDLIKTISH